MSRAFVAGTVTERNFTVLNIINPPKTGKDIIEALSKPPEPKVPVIDELLYRKKVSLITAGPGLGKSTLASQLIFESTIPRPIFGAFDVPKPCKTYYIAFETDWDEFIYSMHKCKGSIPFDPYSIFFDEELLGLDVTQPITLNDTVLNRIKNYKPDIIILDPLYVAAAGDLADGAVASKAMKWLLYVAVKCNSSVLVLHHTHRDRYSQSGKKIEEDDDSYGSRWIQANVVIHYGVKPTIDGTKWKLNKDRYKQSRKEMTLTYDPESGLSTADQSKTSVRDAVLHFLQSHKPESIFTYPQLAGLFNCAEGYLSHLFTEPSFKQLIRKEVTPGKPVKLIRIPPSL